MLASIIQSRRSVRGFLPDAVPASDLVAIFSAAQHSPSWCNTQPWQAWVVSGDERSVLVQALERATAEGMPQPEIPWPSAYPEPYGTRRRESGKALYAAMGIARDDQEGRKRAWDANFRAFDAPHLMIVAAPDALLPYALVDVGIWLQSVMLLAQERGIATCAQASLVSYPVPIRKCLQVPEDHRLVVGLALGYEDPDQPANACRTSRVDVPQSVRGLR